jgi:hypothetical protein
LFEVLTVRTPTPDEINIRLAEYKAAQEMLRHYDTLNWQIGAILIAATTILTGLAFQSEVVKLLQHKNYLSLLIVVAIPLLSWAVLETWHRWYRRHRDLYNLRNETMHRIELELGMYHWLRSAEADQSRDRAANKESLRILETASRRVGYGDWFTPLYVLSPSGQSGADLARSFSRFLPLFQLGLLILIALA